MIEVLRWVKSLSKPAALQLIAVGRAWPGLADPAATWHSAARYDGGTPLSNFFKTSTTPEELVR
jgi:hypothetical protein